MVDALIKNEQHAFIKDWHISSPLHSIFAKKVKLLPLKDAIMVIIRLF